MLGLGRGLAGEAAVAVPEEAEVEAVPSGRVPAGSAGGTARSISNQHIITNHVKREMK